MEAEFKIPACPSNRMKQKSVSNAHEEDSSTNVMACGDAMALNKDGYVHKHLMQPKPSSDLSHLKYVCPGLDNLEITRKNFKDILQEEGNLIIPIIQRRYCWDDSLVSRWYEDTRRGNRDHLGIHNTGNFVVHWSEHDQGLIIIDGQQRMTTTMILLAALRDGLVEVVRDEQNPYLLQLLSTISRLCLMGEHTKLVPCYLDREAFFAIMMGKPSEFSSAQSKAYYNFLNWLKTDLSLMETVGEMISLGEEILNQCICKMGVTLVRTTKEINMPQVFLWLQEKSFGAGLMVHNSSPGMTLFTCDLVRNHVLAPLLNKTLQFQEEFYLKEWLLPLESRFKDRAQWNAAVKRYTLERRKLVQNGDESEFETTFETTFGKVKFNKEMFGELMLYAKFVTAVQRSPLLIDNGNLTCTEKQYTDDSLHKSALIIKDMTQFLFNN